MYSPFEIIRVGTGEPNVSATSSLAVHAAHTVVTFILEAWKGSK